MGITESQGRLMSFNDRYAKEEKDHYQYIKERDGKWVILQKGTGKVLSHHDTREKAISSFKAMMAHKHGNTNLDVSDWRNEYFNLDSDW
jgi:hypothetical protein